ncbi:glutamate receptor-interacting protein 2-like isoform X2 [Rhopilema esculentum]|uniref:glutamate receptor-interacting protein 2-like isoform X2 n=1 Tax=Rhopilema esculentum TaxID=499914 RepID=UPI0031D6D33A
MNKFLTCAPKLERLFIWTRGQSSGGTERWELKENDEEKGIIIVELVKGKNQGLGLTISGGTDKPKPPYVANIRSGGLADQSDYFCVGDLILEINEKDVTKLKHSELIKFIQEAGKRLCFKMQYKRPSAGAVSKTTTLDLCKENGELKFTLRGGRSKDGRVNRPFVVSDLKQESEVASCGDLFEGDIVLAIDNKSIDNLHASEVKSIVKELKTQYSLKIQFNVVSPDLKETPRGSVMMEISRPHESIQPGMNLDVSLDHEQQGSIVVISKLTSSGLATRTGAISVGDLVLSINGISLDGMSVDQARKMMDTSGKVIQLEILPTEQPAVASAPSHGSMNEFLQFLAKDKPLESDLRIRTPTLPLAKPALRQYPSKTSLSSLKRLNSMDRNLSNPKPQELMASYQLNYRSLKRNVLPNTRFASFDDTRSVMSASSTLSQCNVGNMLARTEVTGLVLIAEDGDFGIEVQDGLSGFDMNCIVVRAVLAGKAADRSGVLQAGDRILSISGIRTEFMSSEDFQRALCESGTSVRMEIEFDVTDSIVPSSGTFTVKIPRSENSGIILAETNREDTDKYPRVVDIKKASIAYRMGILVPGDQIIHINGASTSGYSLYEANELIRKCYDVMRITVKKDEEIQGNTFGVEFNRRGEPLGITISGSEEPFDPIYITSIAEESIAGRSGAVLVGDRLLAINEVTLRGKPLWKAFESLRMAGDIVKLLIKRTTAASVPRHSYEKNPAVDSCEMTSASISRDVQQWVMNSNNLEDIVEKERCPTSQGSASTESYCDISDNVDTQSSASDRPSSTKKRVAKRPMLPAWQRECLKNYDDCASSEDRYQEFTKSENFSRAFDSDMPRPLFETDGRSACDVRLKNAFQPIDDNDSGMQFSWNRALSSSRKEVVVYDSSEADCDVSPNVAGYPGADLFQKDTDNLHRILDNPKRSLPFYEDNEISEKNTRYLSPEFQNDFRVDEIVDGGRSQCYEDSQTAETYLSKRKLKSSIGKENMGLPKSSTTRMANLDYNKSKSRLPNQGSVRGLSQAVAFFENLEKIKLPERKSNRSSSLKSFKNRDAKFSDSEKSHTSLTKSPFQLGMTKSERYLREFERKTEAEYKEIKEKLGESSVESIADKAPNLGPSFKLDKFSRFDSGYSTADAKIESPSAPSHSKLGKKLEHGIESNNDDKLRTSTHRIVLTKNEFDKDFGFSISERIDGKGIYVNSIQSNTGKSGKLKKYDRIMQVNGINTRELTCDQVVPLLQRAGRRLQLVVQRVQRDYV